MFEEKMQLDFLNMIIFSICQQIFRISNTCNESTTKGLTNRVLKAYVGNLILMVQRIQKQFGVAL